MNAIARIPIVNFNFNFFRNNLEFFHYMIVVICKTLPYDLNSNLSGEILDSETHNEHRLFNYTHSTRIIYERNKKNTNLI